nr:MAG TPA: hypothetical protein [Caudoviricetes sp.]
MSAGAAYITASILEAVATPRRYAGLRVHAPPVAYSF